MKVSFKFNPHHLLKVSEFCSEDETRLVLNGVLFECKEGASVMLVGTDGRHLGALNSGEMHDSTDGCLFVMPSSLTRLMALYAPYKFMDTDSETGDEFENECEYDGAIEYDADNGRIVAQVDGIRFECDSIKGTYPNWRKYMPEEPVPCAMNMARTLFNPTLVLRAYRFVEEMTIGTSLFDIFGESEKPLCFKSSTAFAAVMPGRGNNPNDSSTLSPFIV